MPIPTPAKWTAESSDRPAAASRSRTSAEAKTSPNALARPPAKRSSRNAAVEETKAIAPVVRALTISPASSQRRREPDTADVAATSAPARYPAKFAEASRPAVPFVIPRSSTMSGRIGV
jgi:hypothetical protein